MDSKGAPYPTHPNPNYPHPQPPPPYQPGFVDPAAQHHHQHHQQPPVVVQQPTIVHTIYSTPQVGPDPTQITCPSCRKQVITRLDFETSTRTHLCAALLCLFICWPCAWVPYVMDSCKNANHYCPSCGTYIGTYQS